MRPVLVYDEEEWKMKSSACSWRHCIAFTEQTAPNREVQIANA